MRMADLYPPGHVLWAIRDGDLHPSHRLDTALKNRGAEKVRLFEVQDVEQVFNQIVFAKDMLRYARTFLRPVRYDLTFHLYKSSHMPHQYDRVLHELL